MAAPGLAIPRPGPQFGKKRVQISKGTLTREQLSESISTGPFIVQTKNQHVRQVKVIFA